MTAARTAPAFILAGALAAALAACGPQSGPAGGAAGGMIRAGSIPVDDSFRTTGQRWRSGEMAVHFYKLERRPGRWLLCVGTVMVLGDGFFHDGFEHQVLSRTAVDVDGRRVIGRLEGNVPVERRKDLSPPATAACFEAARDDGAGGAPKVAFDFPSYIRVVE